MGIPRQWDTVAKQCGGGYKQSQTYKCKQLCRKKAKNSVSKDISFAKNQSIHINVIVIQQVTFLKEIHKKIFLKDL